MFCYMFLFDASCRRCDSHRLYDRPSPYRLMRTLGTYHKASRMSVVSIFDARFYVCVNKQLENVFGDTFDSGMRFEGLRRKFRQK